MNINKKLIALSATVIMVAPMFAMAALGDPVTPSSTYTLPGIVRGVSRILLTIALVAAALSFIVAAFFFITANGDASKVATGRAAIIYAAVGLVVALVAFSLPSIIQVLGGGFV